jgi:Cdc25 family phosphatase
MASISVKELAARLREGDRSILIVDVREHDYMNGHIVGSLHVPFNQFPHPAIETVKEHLSGKVRTVVTHCHYSQNRGPKAAAFLRNSGLFEQVVYLSGGWSAWMDELYETELTVKL